MTQRLQIRKCELRDAGAGNAVVLISGSHDYYNFLRDAFREYQFSKGFNDRFGNYDWGTYIYNIDEEERIRVRTFLDLLTKCIYLKDALNQTFALSYHMRPPYEGGGQTEIGRLVYGAKPYKRGTATEANKVSAIELSKRYMEFIQKHPSSKRADFIVAVPFFGQKPFDLPNFIADQICRNLGIVNGKDYVCKIRKTQQSMKDIKTSAEDKMKNIHGAFGVTENAPFNGRAVVLIDDIYESGYTVHEFGTTLQRAGATVLGLVATKTFKDLH